MDLHHPDSNPEMEAALCLRASVSPRRLVLTVVGVLLGMLLAAIDQTVVGTAMPRILAELGSLEHYAWVFTSYMLASTVTVPIYGKLSDLYGRRPFFLGGMVLFLLGSALSGLSQDMIQLIVFRAVQGLGAGALLPIVQAIFGDVFPPAERGKWQGLLMAVFGLATIIGPAAGGWITETWGWRWVFYVNMPVGAIALLTAGVALPGHSQPRRPQLDYLGAATLSAGTIPLLLACSWAGTRYAWGSAPILGLFAFSIVMIVAFLIVEHRAAEPIISLDLFHNRVFVVSVIAMFLIYGGMYAVIMFLPLFVQGVLGVTAIGSGGILTPMLLAFVVSSAIGGQIMARTGRYKVLALASTGIAVVGMILLAQMSVNTTVALVVRTIIVTGLGIGMMSSLFIVVVQNAFPFRQLGQATATLQFFRSIGGTIGVAILGSIMTQQFATRLQATLPAEARQVLPPGPLDALLNPQTLLSPEATARLQQSLTSLGPAGQELFQQVIGSIRLSLGAAILDVFAVSAIALTMALFVTIFLPELPLRRDHRSTPRPAIAEGVSLQDESDGAPPRADAVLAHGLDRYTAAEEPET